MPVNPCSYAAIDGKEIYLYLKRIFHCVAPHQSQLLLHEHFPGKRRYDHKLAELLLRVLNETIHAVVSLSSCGCAYSFRYHLISSCLQCSNTDGFCWCICSGYILFPMHSTIKDCYIILE